MKNRVEIFENYRGVSCYFLRNSSKFKFKEKGGRLALIIPPYTKKFGTK
jgi:hypothetical protein